MAAQVHMHAVALLMQARTSNERPRMQLAGHSPVKPTHSVMVGHVRCFPRLEWPPLLKMCPVALCRVAQYEVAQYEATL